MNEVWTHEHVEAAAARGWGIFDTDGSEAGTPYQLQKMDEVAVLDSDDQAWVQVREDAASGDALALSALAYLKENSPIEYHSIMHLEVSS
jgi:hypothetical protein